MLSLYHFYLISINQTTYETVRGVYSGGKVFLSTLGRLLVALTIGGTTSQVNPYNNGLFTNWAEVFCGCCSQRGMMHSDEEAWGMLPVVSI